MSISCDQATVASGGSTTCVIVPTLDGSVVYSLSSDFAVTLSGVDASSSALSGGAEGSTGSLVSATSNFTVEYTSSASGRVNVTVTVEVVCISGCVCGCDW